MAQLALERLWSFLTSTELFLGILWLGLAALSVTLLVLMRTGWGQSQPLRKCLILSLLAHVLLVGYATTIQIMLPQTAGSGEPVMRIALVEGNQLEQLEADEKTLDPRRPWEQLIHDAVAQPELEEPDRADPAELPDPERHVPDEATTGDPNLLPATEPTEPEPAMPSVAAPRDAIASGKSAEPIDAPTAQRRDDEPVMPPSQPVFEPAPSAGRLPTPERETSPGAPSSLLDHPSPLPVTAHAAIASDAADAVAGMLDVTTPTPHGRPAQPTAPESVEAPNVAAAVGRMAPPQPVLPESDTTASEAAGVLASSTLDVGPPQLPIARSDASWEVPNLYRLRVAPDRAALARRYGATTETESAVWAALEWLAENQEPNGRWNPARHEGSHETLVDGQDRRGATMQADTGMTGLALLAMLAAGQTHEQGQYQDNVRRGLTYLMEIQRSDGSLAGPSNAFAAAYCHAMAAVALSEAYAMTGDARLSEPVRRAVGYTVAAQDPTGGGWRYLPKDPGDTSQLGWQLMALKSAEMAGVHVPDTTRRGALRFLKTVSSGEYGGLASYRPGQKATRAMTAEALFCRQLLGMPSASPTGAEAGDYLLGDLPGQGRDNLYYWYYATLAMYHLQGHHWERWNEAMQHTLVASQRRGGELAGSWDPNTVWAGYGGRVYSTAMSTLCLEVYYRFLPLYTEAMAPGGVLR